LTQSGYVYEVFSSYQGEGASLPGSLMGRRQVFVRLAGCNLARGDMGTEGCVFCDSPGAKSERCKSASVEIIPGGGRERVRNPLDAEAVLDWILRLRTPDLHSVSVTGGEPLVQARFVGRLAGMVRSLGLRTYLETNGSLPREVSRVAGLFDYACVDIKDKSARAAEDWQALVELEVESASILKDAGCRTFCKTVVTSQTTPASIEAIATRVSELGLPLALQVVTPFGGLKPPSGRQLFSLTEAAAKHLQPEMLAVSIQAHRLLEFP